MLCSVLMRVFLSFVCNFGQLRGDCGYLQKATRHCQLENGIADYRHSRMCKFNLVYFGPQMAKNKTGALTHPPAIFRGLALTSW